MNKLPISDSLENLHERSQQLKYHSEHLRETSEKIKGKAIVIKSTTHQVVELNENYLRGMTNLRRKPGF